MPSDDDETDRKTAVDSAPLGDDTINTGVGGRLASKLASIATPPVSRVPQGFDAPPTDTQVDALPAGAREISIRESITDRDASADLERVRDLVLPDAHSLETLRQGAVLPVDINARLATRQDSEAAQLLRDRALDVRIEMDQLETIRRPSGSELPRAVDVNATIVTQRARTVAEQERDLAFEKLRDGTADELRAERKPRAATDGGQPKRHTTDGLPLLETNAVEIRGDRTPPDDESGTTSRIAGNEMRGTINRRGHDDGPALDGVEQALVGRLRALPPEGTEPDWKALEASIRDEVRNQPIAKPWWQRWQYLASLGALATTAGIALVVMKAHAPAPRHVAVTAPRDAGSVRAIPEAQAATSEQAPALWLDGEPVDLDEVETAALDQIVPDPEIDEDTDVEMTDGTTEDGILPVIDYGWLDTLDDDGVARAESWLARK